MRSARRHWLAGSGAWATLLAFGVPWPMLAAAASSTLELAFDATSLEQALQAMGAPQASAAQITLTVPAQVDDGAFVPVSVTSHLPDTTAISIVVDTNPNPLVVHFTLPAGTEPFVATRVKVAESGRVHAVVMAAGRAYAQSGPVTVQRGGCG
jgi:sulfur-oxidizing protein SoxY